MGKGKDRDGSTTPAACSTCMDQQARSGRRCRSEIRSHLPTPRRYLARRRVRSSPSSQRSGPPPVASAPGSTKSGCQRCPWGSCHEGGAHADWWVSILIFPSVGGADPTYDCAVKTFRRNVTRSRRTRDTYKNNRRTNGSWSVSPWPERAEPGAAPPGPALCLAGAAGVAVQKIACANISVFEMS